MSYKTLQIPRNKTLQIPRDKILHVSASEIQETLSTKGQKLYESDAGTCMSYLKNFNRYYVFSIINTKCNFVSKHVKLPIKFVEKHGPDHKNILEEFLKRVGTMFAMTKFKSIEYIEGDGKLVYLSPFTYSNSMPFGIEGENTIHFFFIIEIASYKEFLRKNRIPRSKD